MVLICADVVRPSLSWLAGSAPARRGLGEEMARTRDSAAFAELTAMCQGGRVGSEARQTALLRIALIMAAKGGDVGDVLVGDCLNCWRPPGRQASRRTGARPARCSTSSCVPAAVSRPARRRRCACSPAAASRPLPS